MLAPGHDPAGRAPVFTPTFAPMFDELRKKLQDEAERLRVELNITENIYNLAIGSIQRDNDSPPLSSQEVVLYNAYIDRVNKFRRTTYASIKPATICSPYVEDDVVKPPTPPQPHVHFGD